MIIAIHIMNNYSLFKKKRVNMKKCLEEIVQDLLVKVQEQVEH